MKTVILYTPDGKGTVYDRCQNIVIYGDIIEFDYSGGHMESNLKFKITN